MNAKEVLRGLTRRELLQQTGIGVGGMALGWLLANESGAHSPVENPLAAPAPHFAPRAKSVIHVGLMGGVSQLDLYDFKPVLNKLDGQPTPKRFTEGQQFSFLRGDLKLLGTPYRFSRHGACGMELSELLPRTATIADDMAIVKSVRTDQINHSSAQLFLLTGFEQLGRPTLGSWVSYGLGSENANLPAYLALLSDFKGTFRKSLLGQGFLPSVYQGVELRDDGDPVLFLSNPRGMTPAQRREMLDSVARLNQARLAETGDPEIASRIAQYEMAFRMQSSVPDLMSLDGETPETLALYGAEPGQKSFANNCLLARRLVERGVRFVQLFDAGWDHHDKIFGNLRSKCGQVDRPLAALIQDLKRRGLLDETLVVWCGEFGRTPIMQGNADKQKVGRDHHKQAFCVCLAGGGVKPGLTLGQTDEIGFNVVEDLVHIHDLNATLLHLLGLDHKRLTYKSQGREFRLTDVHGDVIRRILS